MDILGNWPKWSRQFVKVMPTEYRRALNNMAAKKSVGNAAEKQKAA
jgi:glutamate synthase domain-containing protein 3